jgi:hypothetical protein
MACNSDVNASILLSSRISAASILVVSSLPTDTSSPREDDTSSAPGLAQFGSQEVLYDLTDRSNYVIHLLSLYLFAYFQQKVFS